MGTKGERDLPYAPRAKEEELSALNKERPFTKLFFHGRVCIVGECT